ncbi:MAG: SbcC/MukB-like Walker B domain-containing protein, partial [Sedimenticola sp.]
RSDEVEKLSRLKQILPIWFAIQGHGLWQQQQQRLGKALEQSEARSAQLRRDQLQLEQTTEVQHRLYIEQGGGNIEQLEQQLETHERLHRICQRSADDYLQLSRALGFDATLSAPALAKNQLRSKAERKAQDAQLQLLERQQEQQGGALFGAEQEQLRLKQALQEAQAHDRSNIPTAYLKFRQALVEALGVDDSVVAYVAELVEVKPEAQAWRGAIERALGSHRLRLIVPGEQMKTALAWVNGRDNRLHVRLLDGAEYSGQADFFTHGFTRKLNYGKHPLREVVKAFLADIDRHCVESSELLHRTPHAMTVEGLMSGGHGRFDKQDQRRLDEGWMTGFDNRDRVRELSHELEHMETNVKELRRQYDRGRGEYQQLIRQLELFNKLLEIQFSDIDLTTIESQRHQLQQQLVQLQDPDSDAARAKELWQEAKGKLSRCQQQLVESEQAWSGLQAQMKRAIEKGEQLFRRMGSGLVVADRALANARFTAPGINELESLDAKELEATNRLQKNLNTANSALSSSINKLIRLMATARQVDTGALAEAGTEIQDIPNYLLQLKQLTREALPEKVERFLEYLNKSSDEGVTQLLANIDNQVSIIEERIEDLNQTMIKVDFQAGCYLHLQPHRVIHETLTTIQRAQRELRSASLKEDQGESHYRALVALVALLRDAVERKKTQGAKALLDPRYRLQFTVAVIEREGKRVVEVRTGSQGGSGGEKEIIASYILTASLSYALCPDGIGRPLFGTVVLDEAFSKSSQAVAARIIKALRQFGLHPLFITPNKEMRLLRSHTRSAILVHRRGPFASTTSLSWEELDRQARKRLEAG